MNADSNAEILEFIARPREGTARRPLVTLSYAQSIDGSLTWARGAPTAISGEESLRLTHQLRAAHEAILVGIGTIQADDPQLSVRLVEGPSPQPLVIDSQLRFPLDARLLQGERKPWIFCAYGLEPERIQELEALGCKVIPLRYAGDNKLDLKDFLEKLAELQVGSVMLEGGAGLITSFLAMGLVDRAVITIAPRFIGGLGVLQQRLGRTAKDVFPHIPQPSVKLLGEDLILWGELGQS